MTLVFVLGIAFSRMQSVTRHPLQPQVKCKMELRQPEPCTRSDQTVWLQCRSSGVTSKCRLHLAGVLVIQSLRNVGTPCTSPKSTTLGYIQKDTTSRKLSYLYGDNKTVTCLKTQKNPSKNSHVNGVHFGYHVSHLQTH